MQPIRVVHPSTTPWRAYAIIALLLIFGPIVSFEWVKHWSRVAPGEPATEPNSWIAAKDDSRMQAAAAFKPIMDVQIVSDAEPRESLVGQPVELTAGVRSVPDARGFWVSQVRTPPIFVSFVRGAVKSGDAVELTGKIHKIPEDNEIHTRWPGLKGGDLERLKEQQVYVEAEEVSVTGRY